jgi:hypothetical protein
MIGLLVRSPPHVLALLLLLVTFPYSCESVSAAPPVQILGVSLNDTAAKIDESFGAKPGIRERSVRRYDSGEVERRFQLADNTFVRAVFRRDDTNATPVFLYFALADLETAKSIRKSIEARLGPPSWRAASDKGATVRSIWGGKGAPEAGIQPLPTATFVVEAIIAVDSVSSLTLTTPGWFHSVRRSR